MKQDRNCRIAGFVGDGKKYRVKNIDGKVWIEIIDIDNSPEPEFYEDMRFVDADKLTTFINELMEIRDYIDTHPEFQKIYLDLKTSKLDLLFDEAETGGNEE